MENYKNLETGEIISEECYSKLTFREQNNYKRTTETITHEVKEDDDGNFLLSAIIIGSLLDDVFDSTPSIDCDIASNDISNDVDFGGGDFGGGGAGGDF